MNAEQYQRVLAVFEEVADLPVESQAGRLQLLSEGDEELASRVHELLQEDAGQQSLLDEEADSWLGKVANATLHSDHVRSLIQRQIGPYRLIRVLGEGGMGVVYLAERTDIGGLVAIKLLRDAWLSPMRRARFALEQQTLVKLNHPAIAKLYDANTMEDGTPWFVMEFADGLPFTEFLLARGGSFRDDLVLFRRVCEAVQYAHSHAIIHRDIKPSNILVTAEGEVKLLDFGIAKQLDNDPGGTPHTTAGLRLLTPGYAAPEQFSGGDVGVFTDVYSLGVLLYETLTGQLPEAAEKRGDRPLMRPSAVVRGGPFAARLQAGKREWADLDVLCLKALQPEPERRYGSVNALLRDITSLLEGRVLEAGPNSFAYSAGKFVRRNLIAVVSSTAAIVLLAGGISLFTIRLEHARNAAVAEAARTQRVQQFMLNMLGNSDSEAGPANDLKVATLLDRELQQANLLGSDIDTQAELYLTIGSMYDRLGKYEESERVLNQALEGERQIEKPPGRKVANVLLQLAVLQGDRGELQPARQTLQQAAAIVAASHLAANDPVAIETRIATGRTDVQVGDFQSAVDVLTPVCQLKTEKNEISAYDLRDCVAYLAIGELDTGHYDLAEQADHRAISLDHQLLGDAHPQTAVDLMNLGAIHATRGEFAEAEELYKEGISTMKSWYGPDHPDVVTASIFLARILMSQNKNAEAAGILRQALQAELKAYGLVHERVAYTLSTLGELARRNAQLPIAESYLAQALKTYEALFGDANIKTACVKSDLGAIYLAESNNLPAVTILSQSVSVLENLGGNYLGLTRGRLGRALLALKRYGEAENQLKSAYELMNKMPHQPGEMKNVRAALATLYLVTHRPALARMYEHELQGAATLH